MKRPLFPLVLALLLLPLSLGAQTGPWTAVGSTGVVDESASGIYSFGTTDLSYNPASGSTAPIIARYNVATDFGDPVWDNLELGYFDNSPGSAVSAVLYRVDKCTGNRIAVCTVNSIDSAVATCLRCNFASQPMNVDNFLYYVEVTITRNATNLTPSVRTLRIID
jgi:hypothetical protein